MRSGKVSRGSIKFQVRIRFTCTQVNTMAETTTLTIRVQRGTREALERIARSTRRSKSFIVSEVLATFVQDQRWYAAKIAAGRKSKLVSEAEMNLVSREMEGEGPLERKRKARSSRNLPNHRAK